MYRIERKIDLTIFKFVCKLFIISKEWYKNYRDSSLIRHPCLNQEDDESVTQYFKFIGDFFKHLDMV